MAEKSAGKGISKKLGPLPLWGWLALAGVGARVHGGEQPEARVARHCAPVAALREDDGAGGGLEHARQALQRLGGGQVHLARFAGRRRGKGKQGESQSRVRKEGECMNHGRH